MKDSCKKISPEQTAPKEQGKIVDNAKLILPLFDNIVCFGSCFSLQKTYYIVEQRK
jgi:hypothetical protein